MSKVIGPKGFDVLKFKWLYLGLYFGYPKCCIFNWLRGSSAINMFKMYPEEEDLNLDYVRCHGCIKSDMMDLRPKRRTEYYEIAQTFHDEDLRLIKRERE